VIWPAQTLSFRADAQLRGASLALTLQPLDGVTKAPVGPPWTAADAPISADGRFTANFGTQPVPTAAYPLLDDPFLTVHEFVLTGATISSDTFCGSVSGYAQVLGTEPSDRIRLEGSTFGAVRMTGSALPTPVTDCRLP
jgi:hypothetical protein